MEDCYRPTNPEQAVSKMAQAYAKKATLAALVKIMEGTDTDDEARIMRGWAQRELSQRDPGAYELWELSGEDSPRRFFLPPLPSLPADEPNETIDRLALALRECVKRSDEVAPLLAARELLERLGKWETPE